MRNKRKFLPVMAALMTTLLFSSCVDQSGGSAADTDRTSGRIAATSVACMEICERLDLDLVGVPTTSLTTIPERYAQAVELGSPMSPDLEILKQLSPSWVLSPSSLISDLQPKYEAAGFQYAFLNLKSVFGMYKSIEELGLLLDREEQAASMIEEFEEYYTEYSSEHQDKSAPRVLILMGLPGSYVVATENSYVGSLVQMAGGINVYAGEDAEFINVNTEDMLARDPDIILRTAHALPESVMEMFAEEFATNDIWQHFRAVEKGQVYDLPSGLFGMSATFEYPQALEHLDQLFYQSDLDIKQLEGGETG